MDLDDLEREIIKVTKQGGIARVPEAMVLESMTSGDDDECKQEMEGWITGLCDEYHLARDQDKDMFGQVELLFSHQHVGQAHTALEE